MRLTKNRETVKWRIGFKGGKSHMKKNEIKAIKKINVKDG